MSVYSKNTEKWTPLHTAALSGDAAMVRLLLDAGADKMLRNESKGINYFGLKYMESQQMEGPLWTWPSDRRRPSAPLSLAVPKPPHHLGLFLCHSVHTMQINHRKLESRSKSTDYLFCFFSLEFQNILPDMKLRPPNLWILISSPMASRSVMVCMPRKLVLTSTSLPKRSRRSTSLSPRKSRRVET